MFLICCLILLILFLILLKIKNLNCRRENFDKITSYNKEIFPKPLIWLYWQNKNKNYKKPPYLELCFQTLQKNCGKDFTIKLLDDNKFKKISKTYNPKYSNLKSLAKRSDYISYTLGYEYGGIYMDMDIITKRNLLDLFNKLKKYNFIGFQHSAEIGDISVGFFLCRKNNIICKKLKECMDNHLNQFDKDQEIDIPWTKCASGGDIQKIIKTEVSKGYKYLALDAKTNMYPIQWDKSNEYYWSKNKDISKAEKTKYAIYLHNAMYPQFIKKMNKNEVLNGDYRISHILRKVLNK